MFSTASRLQATCSSGSASCRPARSAAVPAARLLAPSSVGAFKAARRAAPRRQQQALRVSAAATPQEEVQHPFYTDEWKEANRKEMRSVSGPPGACGARRWSLAVGGFVTGGALTKRFMVAELHPSCY
jgi:hypothetical protein